MDNFFIAKQPRASNKKTLVTGLLNKGLSTFRLGCYAVPLPNPVVDMTTVEQRINYYHLLDAAIAHNVPGDVVELGCFTGQCALLFQRVIQTHGSAKALHLFDSFETKFTLNGSVEDALKLNFQAEGLPLPVLHKGYFQDTLPTQLPERIAFVHIDCGFGGDALQHKRVVQYCLESVYPKMSPGAVCVLMDYHDRSANDSGYDANPGVKLACDDFLATKPEKMVSLYGNHYSHGFFRKAGAPG
jgi:O-methyltransferase